MAQLTQKQQPLTIESPLGDDALVLAGFSGQEELSRLYSYRLELVSTRDAISASDLVGKNVSFSVRLDDDQPPRWFNGFVSRLAAGDINSGYRTYQAEVVPWLWFLTRTADCRIFQQKTAPEIIEQIFKDLAFTDYTLNLKGSFRKREYCVQYRETDFNFVSRLMEEEGIFYFFEHQQGKHKLLLANQTGAYRDLPQQPVDYWPHTGGNVSINSISDWQHRYEFVSGKWAQTDYNFETPTTSLMTKSNSVVKLPGIDKFEVYDYPGDYAKVEEGNTATKAHMEETEAAFDVIFGAATCRTLTPGGKFTLAKHPAKDENGKQYVVTSVRHSAHSAAGFVAGRKGGEVEYQNTFNCMPASALFRPQRTTQRPRVSGLQTAVVVGPKGEEIYCDKYGRVKVQFHWDRDGKKDEKSSIFIRCAQSVAGRNWGHMAIPRIGQEVVVDFLEGDPDKPLIVGSVYNNDQMPAYTLPEEKTKSGIKTNSTKGGKGFNELRFEDAADKEQVFLHAQRNMDVRVLHDSLERILNHRHQIIGNDKDGPVGDQRELVYKDKHLHVKGKQEEHIEGDLTLTIGHGDGPGGKVDLFIQDKKTETNEADSDLHVKGNCNVKVDGKDSLTVEGDQHVKVSMNHALDAGMAVHIKAGMTLVLEAGVQLSLKVGGNFIDINPGGVFIQGTTVMINSGGAAGAGSGASPTAPADAKQAEPTKPDEADDAKSGSKSAPG